MDLFLSFQQHWNQHFPQWQPDNCTLVLAVSGGVDSVVLVQLLKRMGFKATIAHCNFQLRGAESDGDELFVRKLAQSVGYPVTVKSFDTAAYAAQHKIAIQEAARNLRYQWFSTLLQEPSMHPALLLTAHHADDNIETMLMHLFRGTGLQGLTGMDAWRDDLRLVRPLLPFRKAQLIAYATENELLYREDASNASDAYTRNFFRNTLIPEIQNVFPQVAENLLHTMYRLQEAEQIYRQSVQQTIDRLLQKNGNEWQVPVLKWKKVTPLVTITYELLKPFGFRSAQTMEAIKLLDAANGSSLLSSTHRLIRNRNWILICPLSIVDKPNHILVDAIPTTIDFLAGHLQFDLTTNLTIPTETGHEVLVDADLLRLPLMIRPWKTGDYFYPLGMQKKKKLSRFFIDQKLSKTAKEQSWVIECDKKIIWVIGMRIDDRFKIKSGTRQALKMRYWK